MRLQKWWSLVDVMTADVACSLCERTEPLAVDRTPTSPWCALCTSIVDQGMSHPWVRRLSNEELDWALHLVGSESRAERRWNRIRANPWVESQTDWARLSGPKEDPIDDWVAGKNCFTKAARKHIKQESLDHDERRALAAGVVLRSGHLLQFLEDRLVVDGVSEFFGAPWRDLLRIVTSTSRLGWDLHALLFAVTGAVSSRAEVRREHRFLPVQHGRRPTQGHALLTWMHVHARLGTPMDTTTREWILEERRARAFERSDAEELLQRRPLRTLEGWTQPWLQAWWDGPSMALENVGRGSPLRERAGRLRIAVPTPRGNGLRTNVPADPFHWAWLASCCLHPGWSQPAHRLLALCAAWRLEGPTGSVSDPLRRSILLLRTVLEDNPGRTALSEGRILVRGRLGHGYSVRAGRGAHGAPFVVHGLDARGQSMGPLCILEDKSAPRRPLGDVLGTVVLSLLDDVNAARGIASLHQHMALTSPGLDEQPVLPEDLIAALPWCNERVTHAELRSIGGRWVRGRSNGDEPVVLTQEAYVAAWKEHAGAPDPERRGTGFWMREMVNRHRRRQAVMEEDGIGLRQERMIFEQVHEFMQGRGDANDPFEAIRRNMVVDRHGRRAMVRMDDPREGQARWRDLYARVWASLSYEAAADDGPVTLLGHPPYDVLVPATNLQFTVRDAEEDAFLRTMLDLAGWTEGEEGRWHRTRPVHANANADLVQRLNALQRTMPGAEARPWWWEYLRDGHQGREAAWRLGEDLRDEG